MRKRHMVICGLPGSTLSHKRHDFRGIYIYIERKMYVLIFSTNFVCFILRIIERNMVKNVYCCTLYSCPILIKLSTGDRFSKNIQIWNFMKIHPVGTESSRRTEMTKLTVVFRNFANATKNVCENYRASVCCALHQTGLTRPQEKARTHAVGLAC